MAGIFITYRSQIQLLSFQQFLAEAILSRKDALRQLGSHIKAGHKKDRHMERGHKIQIPTHLAIRHIKHNKLLPNNMADTVYDSRFKSKDLERHPGLKLKRIPLHSIITSQHHVSAKVVAQKTAGDYEPKQEPRLPTFTKNLDGTHSLHDGNHRIFARKLRGFSHVWGLVHDPAETKKHEEETKRKELAQKLHNMRHPAKSWKDFLKRKYGKA